jgi:hypothetical protein
MLPALTTTWFYVLVGAGGLLGLFLVGAALGLGIYVGHGLLEARHDRKLQNAWQQWYSQHPGEKP